MAEKPKEAPPRPNIIAVQFVNLFMLTCYGGAIAGISTAFYKPTGMLTGISIAFLCKAVAHYGERIIKLCKTKQFQIN